VLKRGWNTKPRNIFRRTLSMFSHYLGKVNSSNLLQITTEKTYRVWQKCNVDVVIRLNGDRRIVFYTIIEVFAVRLHACTIHACAVSDALVDVTSQLLQTLFQFVSVVYPRLVHSLLDDAPDPVINRIKVRAVRWPKIRWNERRRCLIEKSHIVACPVCWALSCWISQGTWR